MISLSKRLSGIEEGIYIDSKKRKWQCVKVVGRWKEREYSSTNDFDLGVEMKCEENIKLVEPDDFREFITKKALVKL